jgi:hypothetical protein
VEAPNMALTLTIADIVGVAITSVGTPANIYQLLTKAGSISLTKADNTVATGTIERIEIHGPSEHIFDGD